VSAGDEEQLETHLFLLKDPIWPYAHTQRCWTKGEHAGQSSSVDWDTAAVVGVRGGTIPRASTGESSSIARGAGPVRAQHVGFDDIVANQFKGG